VRGNWRSQIQDQAASSSCSISSKISGRRAGRPASLAPRPRLRATPAAAASRQARGHDDGERERGERGEG
jgi:hypothetical protein